MPCLEHQEQVFVPGKTKRTKRIRYIFQFFKLTNLGKYFIITKANRETKIVTEATETRRGSAGRFKTVGILAVIMMMDSVTAMMVSIKRGVVF